MDTISKVAMPMYYKLFSRLLPSLKLCCKKDVTQPAWGGGGGFSPANLAVVNFATQDSRKKGPATAS